MSYTEYNTRIVAYNLADDTGDFSCNVYWGGGHRVELYLDGREYRSNIETEIEEQLDSYERSVRYNHIKIERFVISTICSQSLLANLEMIALYDVIELQKLDSNGALVEAFRIRNLDFDDQGGVLEMNSKVEISFERFPIRRPTGGDIQYVQSETVGWDVNGDGTIDTGSPLECQFSGGYNGLFEARQVYQNLRTNSKITLRVIATKEDGRSNTIGVFTGKLGDLLSNSSLWQSGINLWRYFDVTNEIGTNERVIFDKRLFAEENGFLSTESEANSVVLTFQLSSTRGNTASLNLPFVYSIWGGFSSAGVYNDVTGESSVVTIGNSISPNTLNSMQSYRVPLQPQVSASDATYSSFQRVETTNVFSRYSIGTAAAAERYYEGRANTGGYYFFQWNRATYDNDNFTFSVNEDHPIDHLPQLITAPITRQFDFHWKFDRQTNAGGFPGIGEVPNSNPPKIYIDGQLLYTLGGISSTTTFLTGSVPVTLPDTEVHTITLSADTTEGYTIGTEFQCQIKPIY